MIKNLSALWTRPFAVAFAGALATVLAFDVLWSACTSFRALGFFPTYLYAVTLALLMALPAMLFRSRWPMGIMLVVADLLAVANLMYCRTYLGPIPATSYLLAGNVAEYGDAILSSLRRADLVFPVITAVTILLMRGRYGLRKRRADRSGNAAKAYMLTLTPLVVAGCIYSLLVNSPFAHIADLKEDCYYHATPPVIYTLPVSIAQELCESTEKVSEDEKAFAHESLAGLAALKAASPADTTARRYQPENVVFILVESLEAWTLGAKVEGQEITPSLNRLVADTARTWVATKVLSQVGPGRSIDGQLLMTAGLMPMSEYVYSMRFPGNAYPHLSQALNAYNGAESYVLSGDRATTWNEGAVAMSFGIEHRLFRDAWDSSESFGRPRNPSDGSLATQIIDRMKHGEIWKPGEKAFVEIITYSSHFPFHVPEKFRQINLKGTYPKHLAEYITAINYTDNAVGRLVDYIMSRPDASRTMIVIAGDHEALGAMRQEMRDKMRDGKRGASADMAGLVGEAPYVSLIILNAPVAGRRREVMGQVDVYPTVLDQAGLLRADGTLPAVAGKPATASFAGLGISALSPASLPFAVDLSGRLYGDCTSRADLHPSTDIPYATRLIRSIPRVSSAIIRANLLEQ